MRTTKPRTAPQKRSANGGKGFPKGTSGNPGKRFGQPGGNPTDRGGRPAGVAAYVRHLCGEDGELITDELVEVMCDRRRGIWGRTQAASLLYDRGYGKALQEIKIETTTNTTAADDLSYLTDDELDQFEAIRKRIDERKAAALAPKNYVDGDDAIPATTNSDEQ